MWYKRKFIRTMIQARRSPIYPPIIVNPRSKVNRRKNSQSQPLNKVYKVMKLRSSKWLWKKMEVVFLRMEIPFVHRRISMGK
jgi:hypothetical protein